MAILALTIWFADMTQRKHRISVSACVPFLCSAVSVVMRPTKGGLFMRQVLPAQTVLAHVVAMGFAKEVQLKPVSFICVRKLHSGL